MTNSLTLDERYNGVLEPDTMLPSQFFAALRQKTRPEGEQRLLVAVLEDGLNCFQKHIDATDPKQRQLFLDAEEWIMSDDQSWFFSFVNVCETLSLDPDYVREGLLKWRDKHRQVADEQHRAPATAQRETEATSGSLKRASG